MTAAGRGPRHRGRGDCRFVARVLLAAGLTVACAHPQAAPGETLQAFARAAESGDWSAAYALMADDYRRRVPLEAFRAECEADRKIVGADANRLQRDRVRRSEATVRTESGREVRLIFEAGGWKLAEQPITPFGQQSPRAALRTFLRAIDQRRYDVLLRLVPARLRSRVTIESLRIYWEGPRSEAHRRVLDPLRDSAEAPIIELGGEAQMPFGAKREEEGEVRFIFEDGMWKIDDMG